MKKMEVTEAGTEVRSVQVTQYSSVLQFGALKYASLKLVREIPLNYRSRDTLSLETARKD